MWRRYDSVFSVCLTVLAALFFVCVLEAEGLHVWAQRLETGAVRTIVLPLTEAWSVGLKSLGLGRFRQAALSAKSTLAPAMLARQMDAPAELVAPPVLASVSAPAPEPLAKPKRAGSKANPGASSKVLSAEPRLPPIELGVDLQVALAGDSMMAVGLAPSLMRSLVNDKGLRLVRAYRSGTGLARPEVYDWLEHYPKMLGASHPRLVICALGANDGQNVQVGKKVLEFASLEWDEFYRGRLNAYLGMVLKADTQLLWIGMPVMRERRFAQKMRHMNELVRGELLRYPNVTWLDPNPALGYTGNEFAQYRENSRGKMIKMRQDDGIHMTDEGAAFLLDQIRDWLLRSTLTQKN